MEIQRCSRTDIRNQAKKFFQTKNFQEIIIYLYFTVRYIQNQNYNKNNDYIRLIRLITKKKKFSYRIIQFYED